MNNDERGPSLRPSRGLNNVRSNNAGRNIRALLTPHHNSRLTNEETIDSTFDDDNLAPVMPAIDVVKQLLEQEISVKLEPKRLVQRKNSDSKPSNELKEENHVSSNFKGVVGQTNEKSASNYKIKSESSCKQSTNEVVKSQSSLLHVDDDDDDENEDGNFRITNPLKTLIISNRGKKQEDYEFIPKSIILDVYSNDPEVKRFLKQLPKIGNELGFNEQDYKCYSCRRPIGMIFGHSRLCHFDGHHYCSDCHLGDKSCIPAKVLCNWDFNKYPISKRNQHFLTLISNEPMFELKTLVPLLYKHCSELKEVEELRSQAFFIRSYCFTCVHDTVSFELTKLVWPREHLIKHINIYSFEDLIQIKTGTLKTVLKNVINFGRQHVLSCILCCQKGFICEICKSSQIIYPFDTDTVYRCDSCQSIYHKTCFIAEPKCDECPRCKRLKARQIVC